MSTSERRSDSASVSSSSARCTSAAGMVCAFAAASTACDST